MKKKKSRPQSNGVMQVAAAMMLSVIWFLSISPFLITIGLYCELRYGLTDKADDLTWKWSMKAWDRVYGLIPRLIIRAVQLFKSTAPCY